MILGRSDGQYQSFFCFSATNGIKGCTNRGYKSARIIDEAVLSRLMATLFTDDFIADLTADGNNRLAWIAKAEEMGRQLAAKREQLKQLQRAGRRPNVKSVKEKDVVAALGKLRELLQGDVGVAAQVLKALVGDVVIQKQHVDGYENPQMVARFTINAVPALAVLDRGRPTDRDVAPASVWDSIHSSPTAEPATAAGPTEAIIPLAYDRRAAAQKSRKTKRKS
jgi:hypothetical protein